MDDPIDLACTLSELLTKGRSLSELLALQMELRLALSVVEARISFLRFDGKN